jgi:flavin-dependent dehydrogenase
LLATYPPIKKQFENAEMTEKIKGAAIQLSYRKEQLSGVRFLLVGSASASVNPVTGFGVGHAMAAGETAAFTIAKALENDDFSAKALKSYDKALYKRLKNELLMSQILTYIFDHPALCLPTLFRVGHSITSALTHKDFSDEFLNPIFYLKTAFNHKIARYE